jgi:hypothetical protein
LRPVPSPETTAERAGRPGSSAISFDTDLENAVSEALRHPLDPAVARKAPAPFDTQPARAVSRTARHPLDPEIIHEHPGLAQWRMEMLGAVRRFALPVGIAAIAAVFIVITVSAWRADSATSSVSGVTQPMRADPPQAVNPLQAINSLQAVNPPQAVKTEVAPKSALADFQGMLAPSSTNEPVTREQPGKLLQGFLQWRQNSESTEPVEK